MPLTSPHTRSYARRHVRLSRLNFPTAEERKAVKHEYWDPEDGEKASENVASSFMPLPPPPQLVDLTNAEGAEATAAASPPPPPLPVAAFAVGGGGGADGSVFGGDGGQRAPLSRTWSQTRKSDGDTEQRKRAKPEVGVLEAGAGPREGRAKQKDDQPLKLSETFWKYCCHTLRPDAALPLHPTQEQILAAAPVRCCRAIECLLVAPQEHVHVACMFDRI